MSSSPWAQGKRHLELGEAMLANLRLVSAGARRLILERHERCDGGGYPYEPTRTRIHQRTHPLVMADRHDALTSNRPYRPAYSPFQALSLMSVNTGVKFPKITGLKFPSLGYLGWLDLLE
jgi:putative two-component system response regulator